MGDLLCFIDIRLVGCGEQNGEKYPRIFCEDVFDDMFMALWHGELFECVMVFMVAGCHVDIIVVEAIVCCF